MENENEEQVSTPLRPDNVISQKILNILSTSYTDSSIRMALLTLDDRMDENTMEARRELRSNTEAEVLKQNGNVLKEFSKLSTKLRSIGDTIDNLNGKYKEMDQLVSQAHRCTSQIIHESSDLKAQDDKIIGKQVLLEAFENTFAVSEEEAGLLTSSSRPINEDFYKALEKVKRVRDDCSALMANENQVTGVEIMAQMTDYLDKGYDKLLRFVQQDFRTISGQDMQIGRQLKQRLNKLAERPTLFETALNGLCETRQKNLSQEFIKALTAKHDGNKPIDYYAFDTLRYIGDILAWIHSAAVNERENLDTLFGTDTMVTGLKQGQESEPWTTNELFGDTKQMVDSLVDKITSTLVKPLQTRIQQVLSGEPKLTITFQADNVLIFYASTFSKHLDPESKVIKSLEKLQESCMRQFKLRLEDRINSVKEQNNNNSKNSNLSTDLQPPDFLQETLADLKSCLTSYESSIAYSPSGSDSIRQVVEDMIEPYLEYCNRAASNMKDVDEQIFMINCYDAVKMALSLYPFAEYKMNQLENRIQELADVLETRQYQSFLDSSKINQFTNLEDKDQVQQLSIALDDFLPAATMESNMSLYKLASPRLASTITLRASQQFAEEFARVESKLREIYSDLSPEEFKMLFPRSLQDVNVLLAIE